MRDENDKRLPVIHVRVWVYFTLLYPQASRVGVQLEGIYDDALCASTIGDIRIDRRTGTLAAWISALSMYVRWASSHGIVPNQDTHIQEELAHKYVCTLRSESLPSTHVARFREAIALSLHILGMDANA
jgi:hypothetical protein